MDLYLAIQLYIWLFGHFTSYPMGVKKRYLQKRSVRHNVDLWSHRNILRYGQQTDTLGKNRCFTTYNEIVISKSNEMYILQKCHTNLEHLYDK